MFKRLLKKIILYAIGETLTDYDDKLTNLINSFGALDDRTHPSKALVRECKDCHKVFLVKLSICRTWSFDGIKEEGYRPDLTQTICTDCKDKQDRLNKITNWAKDNLEDAENCLKVCREMDEEEKDKADE